MPNSTRQKPPADMADSVAQRRRYDSPVRRQQTAETKQRIIAAGAELVHEFPAWDWTNLTARAVGERAGVSERTVHRYFPSERKLRDAVIQRLVEESGASLEDLTLSDFANVTQHMFGYLSSFAAQATPASNDPTLATMDKYRRDVLITAIARETPTWSERDRENVAAVLDILWNLAPYERLVVAWGFDADRAISILSWLISMIQTAIRQDRKP